MKTASKRFEAAVDIIGGSIEAKLGRLLGDEQWAAYGEALRARGEAKLQLVDEVFSAVPANDSDFGVTEASPATVAATHEIADRSSDRPSSDRPSRGRLSLVPPLA